jgi:hypothetical protein
MADRLTAPGFGIDGVEGGTRPLLLSKKGLFKIRRKSRNPRR